MSARDTSGLPLSPQGLPDGAQAGRPTAHGDTLLPADAGPELWIDPLPHPLWVLGAGATVLGENAAARLIGSRVQYEWIVVRERRFDRLGHWSAQELAARVQALPAGETIESLIADVHGRPRRATARLVAVDPSGPYPRCWPGALALLSVDGHPAPAHDAGWLRLLAHRYRLTPTERRVLAGIAAGDTPAELAGTLGVSPTTVRTHLRALFSKTGCRRQPELVRLYSGG